MPSHPFPRVIFHADDLGYSYERDSGILASPVTRASLLVTGGSARSGLERALARGLEVVLHLNLTEGAPLSPHVPTLLGPGGGGVMRGKVGFREAVAKGEVSMGEVGREALAQYHHFMALHPHHLPPRAFDGHQHVHVLPPVAVALAAALGGLLTATRIPQWAGAGVEPLDHLVESGEHHRKDFYLAVSRDAQVAQGVYAAAGIAPVATTFIGFGLCGKDCTLERALRTLHAASALAEQRGGWVEWMTHPGFRTLPRGDRRGMGTGAPFIKAPPAAAGWEKEEEEGGGATFTLGKERAEAWARVISAQPEHRMDAGCAPCPPDEFACTWERERELAVLVAVMGGGRD